MYYQHYQFRFLDFMETKNVQMPISKLSYSGLTQLLRNPLIFKLKQVLGVYDGKMSMSGMVGRAGHEALKYYNGGESDIPRPMDINELRSVAIDIGMNYLEEYSDIYINYGKTGSREQMIKTYSQAMRFYFAEEPEYHEILMCEEKMEAELKTVDGDILPLPAVGIPDVVHKRKDGGVEIIDTKFTKNFTKYENDDGEPHEDYIKIVQAQFLWHLLRETKGITADRVLFREIKVTENKDGSPQVRDYAIPCNHEAYRVIFYNLYKDVVKFLSNPDAVYLPNLSDPFDGEQAGLLYAQGLLSADMSDVEVMHKVKDVAFVSKKFVASRLDSIENQHLNPEEKIRLRLAEFGIPVEPVEPIVGPSVTQYRFKVSRGVRMSTIQKHKADIARAVEAKTDITILAPIPGTDLMGVEVQNENKTSVDFTKDELTPGTLILPIGKTIEGISVRVSLDEMPHLLIAGATGSGKSILVHTILHALTEQMKPENMHLVLIDPKRVELVAFSKKKHLHGGKIAYDYGDSILVLKSLTDEMEARYKLLEKAKVRNIKEYNENEKGRAPKYRKTLPYIVVVVDEFADLMLQGKASERRKKARQTLENIVTRAKVEQMAKQCAKQGLTFNPGTLEDEVATAEEMITRLAQMARAVGIHLIIATQRPSVDVITGLIKANFPARIALTTASATDSKVILGHEGAEKLGGKGDMLFAHPGQGIVRLQGFLIK